jgi:hypothetical protein
MAVFLTAYSCLPWIVSLAPAGEPLPGDDITGFRIVEIFSTPQEYWQWNMKLEVNYTYHPKHQKVIVGAYVLPFGNTLETGHSYWGFESQHPRAVEETPAGSVIRGIQRVSVGVRLKVPEQPTHELRIFLYNPNEGEFFSRTYNYERLWKLSAESPGPLSGMKVVPTPVPSPPVPPLPSPSPGPGKRTILPDGAVEIRYPDGTIKRTYKDGYVIIRPDGTTHLVKYAQVQKGDLPPQPTEATTIAWLQAHSEHLLGIISGLVGNDQSAVDNYLRYEGTGTSDYEKINKRTQTIGYLLAP